MNNQDIYKKKKFQLFDAVIVKIAWKNIWRNKLRSSIVLLAFTVGIFGGLASVGSMKGMTQEMVENALETEVSHIQIHSPEFQENNEVKYTLNNVSQLVEEIKKDSAVEAVVSRTKVFGMVSTASKGTGVMINGIDTEAEKEVSVLYSKLTDTTGTWFETEKKNRIVISEKLAEKLNAHIKSKIIITFQDYDGNLIGASFKVVGIFKTQNSVFDELNVFVKKQDINRLLNLPDDKAHELAIILKDYKQGGAIAEGFQEKHTELKVEPWFSINPYLQMSVDMVSYMLLIFMAIILLALGFVIVNTMLMAILERKKELGMIMAIGMNRTKIFAMIMWETIFLSLTGAVIGILISFVFTAYYGQYGIDVSSVGEGFSSAGFGSTIYPSLDRADYIQIVILVLITGLISSIFPAIRALKMKPAEAVKE